MEFNVAFIKLTKVNGDPVVIRSEDVYGFEIKSLLQEQYKNRTHVRTDPHEEWAGYFVRETVEEVLEQLNSKK